MQEEDDEGVEYETSVDVQAPVFDKSIRELFTMMDPDKTGAVAVADLRVVAPEVLGRPLRSTDGVRFLIALEKQHGGQIGYDAFAEWWRERLRPANSYAHDAFALLESRHKPGRITHQSVAQAAASLDEYYADSRLLDLLEQSSTQEDHNSDIFVSLKDFLPTQRRPLKIVKDDQSKKPRRTKKKKNKGEGEGEGEETGHGEEEYEECEESEENEGQERGRGGEAGGAGGEGDGGGEVGATGEEASASASAAAAEAAAALSPRAAEDAVLKRSKNYAQALQNQKLLARKK